MPKSNDIAIYVMKHGVTAEGLVAMLTKYNALAMLPNIFKKIKHYVKQNNPDQVLELAHDNIDAQVIDAISSKYALSTPNVIYNKELIAGYKVIKDYKMYDLSVSGYIDRLFR